MINRNVSEAEKGFRCADLPETDLRVFRRWPRSGPQTR